MKKVLIGAAATILTGSALAVPVILELSTDAFGDEDNSFEMVLVSDGLNIAYDMWSSPTDTMNAGLDDGFADLGDLLSDTDYTFEWDLGAGDYEFTIFDSFGDGLDADAYTLTVDGVAIASGGEFGSQETTAFTIDSTTVSEPGTFLLFGLGFAGLALTRRLRKS